MFQPKLGVSLKLLTYELTEEWIEAIARSRIATLEIMPPLFSEEHPESNKSQLKKLLARTGIRVRSVHANYGNEYDFSRLDETTHRNALAEYPKSIDLAVEFDAPIIVTHMSQGPVPDEERPARLRQARRGLVELAEPCRKAHRKMALEVLNGVAIGNTIEELSGLIDGLDEEIFGICLDVNHVMECYAALPEMVRSLGSQLTTLHLSDYDGVAEKHWMPGAGVIDWKALMDAFRDIDYSGPFNYEVLLEGETPADKIERLESNFDWLRGLQEAVA